MFILKLSPLNNYDFSYRGTSGSCANKVGFRRGDMPGDCRDRGRYLPASLKKSHPVKRKKTRLDRLDRNAVKGDSVSPFLLPCGLHTIDFRPYLLPVEGSVLRTSRSSEFADPVNPAPVEYNGGYFYKTAEFVQKWPGQFAGSTISPGTSPGSINLSTK